MTRVVIVGGKTYAEGSRVYEVYAPKYEAAIQEKRIYGGTPISTREEPVKDTGEVIIVKDSSGKERVIRKAEQPQEYQRLFEQQRTYFQARGEGQVGKGEIAILPSGELIASGTEFKPEQLAQARKKIEAEKKEFKPTEVARKVFRQAEAKRVAEATKKIASVGSVKRIFEGYKEATKQPSVKRYFKEIEKTQAETYPEQYLIKKSVFIGLPKTRFGEITPSIAKIVQTKKAKEEAPKFVKMSKEEEEQYKSSIESLKAKAKQEKMLLEETGVLTRTPSLTGLVGLQQQKYEESKIIAGEKIRKGDLLGGYLLGATAFSQRFFAGGLSFATEPLVLAEDISYGGIRTKQIWKTISEDPVGTLARIPGGLIAGAIQDPGYFIGAATTGASVEVALKPNVVVKKAVSPFKSVSENFYYTLKGKLTGDKIGTAIIKGENIPYTWVKGTKVYQVPDIHLFDAPLDEIVTKTRGKFVKQTTTYPEVGGFYNLREGQKILYTGTPEPHWGIPTKGAKYSMPSVDAESFYAATQFGGSGFKSGAVSQESKVVFSPFKSGTVQFVQETPIVMPKNIPKTKAGLVTEISKSKYSGKSIYAPENVLGISQEFQVISVPQQILISGQKVRGSAALIKKYLGKKFFYVEKKLPEPISGLKTKQLFVFGLNIPEMSLGKAIEKFYQRIGLGREYKTSKFFELEPKVPVGRPPLIQKVMQRPRVTGIVKEGEKFLFVEERTGTFNLPGGGLDPVLNELYYVGKKKPYAGWGRWVFEESIPALKREFKEEISIGLKNVRSVPIRAKGKPYVSSQGFLQQDVLKVFEAEKTGALKVTEKAFKSGEIGSAKFLSLSEVLSSENISSDIKNVISRYAKFKQKGKVFPVVKEKASSFVKDLGLRKSKTSVRGVDVGYALEYSKYTEITLSDLFKTYPAVKYYSGVVSKGKDYVSKTYVQSDYVLGVVDKVMPVFRREYPVSYTKEPIVKSIKGVVDIAKKDVEVSPVYESYVGEGVEFVPVESVASSKSVKYVEPVKESFFVSEITYPYRKVETKPYFYEEIIKKVTPPPVVDKDIFKEEPKDRGKFVRGWNVVVKERGVVKKLNQFALPKNRALNVGAQYTDAYPVASFELRKTKKKLPPMVKDDSKFFLADKFRQRKTKKALLLVEKTKYRIDSPFEVIGIPKKGQKVLKQNPFLRMPKRKRKAGLMFKNLKL